MGTDYNAIVDELNRPTAYIRPKGQPSEHHAMITQQVRMKIRTGNGEDAHLWTYKSIAAISPNMSEKEHRKLKERCAAIRARRTEQNKIAERAKVEQSRSTLSSIFGIPAKVSEAEAAK